MRFYLAYIAIIFTSFNMSCNKRTSDNIDDNVDTIQLLDININPFSLDMDTNWFDFNSEIAINPTIDEASGIIPSFLNDSCYWINEDSGSPGRIFLYSINGNRKGTYNFKGIGVTDMEELAYYHESNDRTIIYVGDFGDNNVVRNDYKIIELNDVAFANGESIDANSVKIIRFEYRDEKQQKQRYNCEAFICDPLSKNLYLFTKQGSLSEIYKLEPPFDYDNVNIAKKIGSIHISSGQKVTAADISFDRNYFVLKTYDYIFIWNNKSNLTLEELLKSSPKKLPYVGEAQGEAFCFSTNSSSYITTSEYKNGILPKLQIHKHK